MNGAVEPRPVIVGGGVVGMSLAYALGRRALPALLLERGRIGRQGASSGPAALINPQRGSSARAHPDDLAGARAFWRVVEELRAQGLDPGAERSGVLRIAPSERRARAWRRLEGVHWLEPERVPAPYRAPFGALLAEDAGWLRPRRLLAALRSAAEASGVEVREGVRLLAAEPMADGVRLVTSAGTLVTPQLLLCIGADPSPGLELPATTAVAGDVVTFSTAELGRPRLPLGGSVYAAFDGTHGYVGGNHRDPDVPEPEAPARLLHDLGRWLPGAAELPGTALWSGVRARGATPRPVVREVAPHVTFVGAMSGRGFLCAADVTSRLAARLNEGGAS